MTRMLRYFALVSGCAHAFVPARAGAQFVAPDSGMHVRIGRDGESVLQEGSFVSASADSLRMRPGSGTGVISVPIRSIRTLDVSNGPHVSAVHVFKDAAIGGGIGVGTTVVIIALSCDSSRSDDGPTCGIVPYLIGVPLTLLGIGIGTWIGVDHPINEWRRTYDRGRTTGLYLGPTRRGDLAIGVSVAFGAPPGAP